MAITHDPRIAYKADGKTLKHSPQCTMAFGRLDPDNCARCEERAAERAQGIPARVHEGFQRMRELEEADARRAQEIEAHFASAKHRNGGCGICCTYGDW